VQLEQSPFLNILSDQKVNTTLKLMGRQPGESVTAPVARELCERAGSKAVLAGSIVNLGGEYVIGLDATNCASGDSLAREQARSSSKAEVLKALDKAATNLRRKLGESLGSVQKFATPIEEATTSSLEALKTYSLARKTWNAKGNNAPLPLFKRAVELDPNFAMAYARIGTVYSNLGAAAQAAEFTRKAYDLRQKVSERERLYIESHFFMSVTGEVEKAVQVYELWQQTYPRDAAPYVNLAGIYGALGQHDKSLAEAREALRLDPSRAVAYGNLAIAYMALNRLEEVEAVLKQVEERKLEGEFQQSLRYQLAFLKGDRGEMAHLVAAAAGKPGAEDLLLSLQAVTETWNGRIGKARELTRRAIESAMRNNTEEIAALYQAEAALREAELGNRARARADALAAVKLARNRDVNAMAALGLARAGDTAAAEKLAAELNKQFPLDTLAQRYWLPSIRAAVELERNNVNQAVASLQATSSYELGVPTLDVSLYPVYLRGQSYLLLREAGAAATEFQKFLDHRGIVLNFPLGALARLGLARAYALQGETAKAHAAYEEFLTLWKDADSDIPILQQAKAEYAKLK
jgi:Flp pilus assembly protein TadD